MSKHDSNNKRHELLISEKQSLCRFKNENPFATRVEIAHHFHAQWGRKISLSTIKEVLSKKEHWLAVHSAKYGENRKRLRLSKIREVENALYVCLCDIAASTPEPITSKLIRATAKAFLEELVPEAVKFNYSSGWLTGLKRRFSIHLVNDSIRKCEYDFDSVARNKTSLLEIICKSKLENVYILIPVQLFHCYNPHNDNPKTVFNNALLVFLCVNVAGTDMMPPLVLGSSEISEKVDKIHYVQEGESTWGFVHWLWVAERHINNQAVVIASPHRFITCLPFNHFKFQLYKTSVQSFSVLKEVYDRVTFLFKASFRRMQLKNMMPIDSSYLAQCLVWVRDAWWGLPGGALHGYWHQIPEVIESGHKCTLPQDTSKLCTAIEDIATKNLTASLHNTNVEPVHLLNIEHSLSNEEKLSLSEIVNILLLYNKLLKNVQENNKSVNIDRQVALKNVITIPSYENATSTDETLTESVTIPVLNNFSLLTTEKSTAKPFGCYSTIDFDGLESQAADNLDVKSKYSIFLEESKTKGTDESCVHNKEDSSVQVTNEEALAAIDKVITYLSLRVKERKLYKDALKIWNYIDTQKSMPY